MKYETIQIIMSIIGIIIAFCGLSYIGLVEQQETEHELQYSKDPGLYQMGFRTKGDIQLCNQINAAVQSQGRTWDTKQKLECYGWIQ